MEVHRRRIFGRELPGEAAEFFEEACSDRVRLNLGHQALLYRGMELLFVYGTLRGEFDNQYARLLRSQAALIGRATVRGSIYRVDSYPAYKPDSAGEVHGELYRLGDPAATLHALDDYEGEGFARVKVETSRGEAWIYRYRGETAADSRIASGDFCAQ